jgi:acyl-CoA synthetase (NDP forming)
MGEMDVAAGVQILQRRSIPHYVLPESMCTAYAGALFFKQQMAAVEEELFVVDSRMVDEASTILTAAKGRGPGFLREEEAVAVLGAFGLPVLTSEVAASRDVAVAAAKRIGFPVVMKVSSDDITHKIDVHGVVLGIEDARDAGEAFDAIISEVRSARPDASLRGVLVQKMANPGVEVILGIKRDPSFGGVVTFGLGGTFVEIFKDVSFRVAPFGSRTAGDLIEGIKAHPILAGARGKARRDIASVQDCVLRLSALASACPDVQELDINPFIVGEEGKGSAVADVRILV